MMSIFSRLFKWFASLLPKKLKLFFLNLLVGRVSTTYPYCNHVNGFGKEILPKRDNGIDEKKYFLIEIEQKSCL